MVHPAGNPQNIPLLIQGLEEINRSQNMDDIPPNVWHDLGISTELTLDEKIQSLLNVITTLKNSATTRKELNLLIKSVIKLRDLTTNKDLQVSTAKLLGTITRKLAALQDS